MSRPSSPTNSWTSRTFFDTARARSDQAASPWNSSGSSFKLLPQPAALTTITSAPADSKASMFLRASSRDLRFPDGRKMDLGGSGSDTQEKK